VCTSLRRKPLKPTIQEKGKAINLEPKEEEMEDIPLDEEEVGIDVEEVEAQGVDPITQFLEYVPPCKGNTKAPKDIKERKVPLQTPLLSNENVSEGPRLGQIPPLKLEYSGPINFILHG